MSSRRGSIMALTPLLLVLAEPSPAFDVRVQDARGQALGDAVVLARPLAADTGATSGNATAVIDQIGKTFVPRVSAIRSGTTVSFPNKDDIRHHVYSFSPPKIFQLKLYHGLAAQPVTFDKPGLVVLGCNIHDDMIAYLYVVDAPHFALTDKNGVARMGDLPTGEYSLTAWHYRMDDGTQAAASANHHAAAEVAAPVLRVTLRTDSPLPPPLE